MTHTLKFRPTLKFLNEEIQRTEIEIRKYTHYLYMESNPLDELTRSEIIEKLTTLYQTHINLIDRKIKGRFSLKPRTRMHSLFTNIF